MKEYNEFVDRLKLTFDNFNQIDRNIWLEEVKGLTDGMASNELRKLISLENRRNDGVFFTDSKLANKVIASIAPTLNNNSVIYDPACGAGNLLIAISEYANQKGIVLNLPTQLLGTDIHNEFIQATKLRLTLSGLANGGRNLIPSAFDNSILQLDGLNSNQLYKLATHIIVNPPFNLTVNNSVSWSKGKISAAALFLDKIIENVLPGTSIIAILPDVLRSGTRYEKWRKHIKEACKISKIKLLGQFDNYTDVDVYCMHLEKRVKRRVVTQIQPNAELNITSKFDVRVGSVVDNRDPKTGPRLPYLVSRGLKSWESISQIALTRKHDGVSIQPPFIVVKRTSRKGDKNRANATIINSPGPVLVDNHLIILKPKDNGLQSCNLLLNMLKDNLTDSWLDKKIRCRHLTVKVLKELPIWPGYNFDI